MVKLRDLLEFHCLATLRNSPIGFNEYSDLQLSGYQIVKFYTNYSGIRMKNIRKQIVFTKNRIIRIYSNPDIKPYSRRFYVFASFAMIYNLYRVQYAYLFAITNDQVLSKTDINYSPKICILNVSVRHGKKQFAV